MGNVINLFYDAPQQLRDIADEMEKNPAGVQTATVIWGTEVYQAMDSKQPMENAAREAVFNCQFAISKLMSAAVGFNVAGEDDE